jgi:predicted nucleotidyltransferase
VAVLTWLCQHPDEPVHTRELARRCGLAPNQTYRQLRRLEAVGLLRSQRVGRSRVYRVEPGFPLLPELRSIILKTTGLAGRLREAVSEVPAEVALIFGSVAAGQDDRESDVDLLVIGDVSGRALAEVTQPLQAEIGRAINAVRYGTADFRTQAEANDPFVGQVLGGPKVFVKGGPDDLRRLAG